MYVYNKNSNIMGEKLEDKKIHNEDDNCSSNNILNNDIEDVNKKKRSTKKEIYNLEREELIKELNRMIGIDENNHIFLYELERNERIKEFLKNNINKIRRIHKIGYFSNEKKKGKDNEIGLLRSLYLDNDYEILSKLKINNFDNVKKQYTQLIFFLKIL